MHVRRQHSLSCVTKKCGVILLYGNAFRHIQLQLETCRDTRQSESICILFRIFDKPYARFSSAQTAALMWTAKASTNAPKADPTLSVRTSENALSAELKTCRRHRWRYKQYQRPATAGFQMPPVGKLFGRKAVREPLSAEMISRFGYNSLQFSKTSLAIWMGVGT